MGKGPGHGGPDGGQHVVEPTDEQTGQQGVDDDGERDHPGEGEALQPGLARRGPIGQEAKGGEHQPAERVDDPKGPEQLAGQPEVGQPQDAEREGVEQHKGRLESDGEPDLAKRPPPHGRGPAKPQGPELGDDLEVAPGPAQPLLPETLHPLGLLGPAHGAALEHHLAAVELGEKGRDGVLGLGRVVDAPAEALQVLSGVELRSPGHTPEDAHDVRGTPRQGLREDVLEADEAGQRVARRRALPHVAAHRSHLGIG